MPVDFTRYGPGWHDFTRTIKINRANLRCECTGQCGLHGGKVQGRRCVEVHGEKAQWARGKIILTTAHLCSCDPPCQLPHHVLAMCQRCHLRLDRKRHVATRLARRPSYNGPPAPDTINP